LGFVFLGGPGLDNVPDVVISKWHSVARLIGDINRDGFSDFIIGHPLEFSGIGEVYVYYGGDNVDSIPDVSFENSSFPGYQIYFGRDCSGVGDFNGDGIDDFAFSVQDLYGYGLVLIYSGVDVGTDTPEETASDLPKDYALSQNHPNPFNGTTTIDFSLPSSSYVVLNVYNVMGQRVSTLIDKIMRAGNHSVRWNAVDDTGAELSSGIYIYRIATNGQNFTGKMVLLK
jgi:hypothetical protein